MDRRSFLKTSAVAGVASAGGGSLLQLLPKAMSS